MRLRNQRGCLRCTQRKPDPRAGSFSGAKTTRTEIVRDATQLLEHWNSSRPETWLKLL